MKNSMMALTFLMGLTIGFMWCIKNKQDCVKVNNAMNGKVTTVFNGIAYELKPMVEVKK